jgi:osmotically-inducible protein OsmY
MSNNPQHRDYGGSSGGGNKSNHQSQTTGDNKGPELDDHRALDERLLNDITERLAQYSELDTSRIIVEVRNRYVTLKGRIGRSEMIDAVSHIVKQTPGVREVEAHLAVE